jgi:Zn-dependent protease
MAQSHTPRIGKLTEVMRVSGAPVYVHWSLLVIGALILLGAYEKPAETLTAWACFFGVLLIHESGHLFAARGLGYYVNSIVLYPFWGCTNFQAPRSRFDHAVIAWGGVAAQAIVAVPAIAWLKFFGYTRFDPLNVALGILGYYSIFVAAFNLIPVAPLDGAVAWRLIPALLKRPPQPIQRRDAYRKF